MYENLKPLLSTLPSPPSKREALLALERIELDIQARYPAMRKSDVLARMHAELEARYTGKPILPGAIITVAASETSSATSETGIVKTGLAVEETSRADAGEKGGMDVERHVRFARNLATWPVFPDTIDALERLSKHFKLCVLSNIDHELFAHTQRALEGPPGDKRFEFAAVYTAEDAGAFKPDPQALKYALKRLQEEQGVKGKEEVLVVAQSAIHDLIPAKREGVRGAWINRPGASMGFDTTMEKFDWEFATLGEMADAVEKEVKGV